GADCPARLHFATQCDRLDCGGLAAVDGWLTEHPDARLVIVDTLQKVRPPRGRDAGVYADDYAVGAMLKRCADVHGVALVAVHHLNKLPNVSDPLDALSGSTGLAGAADGALILRRQRDKRDATLFDTGRDINISEPEQAVTFDATTCQWVLVGDAKSFRISQERQ